MKTLHKSSTQKLFDPTLIPYKSIIQSFPVILEYTNSSSYLVESEPPNNTSPSLIPEAFLEYIYVLKLPTVENIFFTL